MIPLVAYRDNSCDPRKCTVKKLERAGHVRIVKKISQIPRNTLLLDPTAEQALSPADKSVKSITALDCSWEVLIPGWSARGESGGHCPFLWRQTRSISAGPAN